jgi:8-oxo-dGTP pyrophosphatase MutT (NUDIX family)
MGNNPESNWVLAIRNEIMQSRAMESEQPARVRRSRFVTATENETRAQVAAVCFRILSSGIEFLLVRTRKGRWTFPKGGVQTGLSFAQSAAIEAYEEAGVHGRIEEVAFIRYSHRKFTASTFDDPEKFIHAHLCEVLQIESPLEPGRDPTWFSSAKTKRRLAEGRTREIAADLNRVVDRAVARIRRFPLQAMVASDALLKIKFEASEVNVTRLRKEIGIGTSSNRARDQASNRPGPVVTTMRRGAKLVELRPGKINYV